MSLGPPFFYPTTESVGSDALMLWQVPNSMGNPNIPVNIQGLTFGSLAALLNAGTGAQAFSKNSTLYFEGSSITRGEGLGTAQLPNGGLTGCFGNLLSGSAWGTGNGTYYNDAVTGSTIAQAAARYTTGNSDYGVTVPSAYSLAPIRSGATNRCVFFVDMAIVYNSAGHGVDLPTCLSQLQAFMNTVRADGWYVVLLTSPIISYYDFDSNQVILAMNEYARKGQVPYDLLADSANWIADQRDTRFYTVDEVHPNARGHQCIFSNLLSGVTANGFPVSYSYNYIKHPIKIFNGGSGPALDISTEQNPQSATVKISTSSGTYELGVGSAAEPGAVGAFFIRKNGVLLYVLSPAEEFDHTWIGNGKITNTLTGARSGGGSSSAFVAESVEPSFCLLDTDGPANQRKFDFHSDGGELHGRLVNDANDSAFYWLTVITGGGTVTGIEMAPSVKTTHIPINQPFSDTNISVNVLTETVQQVGALTATRNVALPPASSVAGGRVIRITDISGTATLSENILILPNSGGVDTINGLSSVSLETAYGSFSLESDGVSSWAIVAKA